MPWQLKRGKHKQNKKANAKDVNSTDSVKSVGGTTNYNPGATLKASPTTSLFLLGLLLLSHPLRVGGKPIYVEKFFRQDSPLIEFRFST